MLRRSLRFVGLVATFLISPVSSQFGIAKKKGTTFEEVNEMAKQQFEGAGGLDLEALSNLDMDQVQQMIQEAMKDPATKDAMNKLNKGVEDAMAEISKLSPEELKQQMQEGLEMLTSGDMVDTLLGKKEEVLKTLADQGLVDAGTLEEYEKNPEKFESEMKNAFEQMKDIFSNEETLSAATQMLHGFSELLADPDKAMKELAEVLQNELSDDDKIEEARLTLLADPEKAGNANLAKAFQNDEMQEILKDPVKWREQVKKGQEMLLGGKQAAGMGEL